MKTPTKTAPRHLVFDGVTGADVYGTATTPRGALNVAAKWFADGVKAAYLDPGPFDCADGLTRQGPGWIVLSGAYEGEIPPGALIVGRFKPA